MRLDITKIDDRIKRLQELKRLLSDAEMASVVFECVISNDLESPPPLPPPSPRVVESQDSTASLPDGVEGIMNEVLEEGRWKRSVLK